MLYCIKNREYRQGYLSKFNVLKMKLIKASIPLIFTGSVFLPSGKKRVKSERSPQLPKAETFENADFESIFEYRNLKI